MGCDIHGCWEVQLSDGRWFAFRTINDERDYRWFGIMSGVRHPGPQCSSEPWDPTVSESETFFVSDYWREVCVQWGDDLHSHTCASVDAVTEANNEFNKNVDSLIVYEQIPHPNDIVGGLWLGGINDLPMNITLRDVMGLQSDIDCNDERFKSRIRYCCAYDN